MDYIFLIKEYQTLIGSLVGSFLAIISSVGLWFLNSYFKERKEIEDSKKEIERIFIAALRECEDSINNIKFYVESLEKNIRAKNESFDVIIPPKFNRVVINEDHLIGLSKNLHSLVCEQINIANSAAKKFNGWLEQFEETPIFLFEASMKVLQAGLKTKEETTKEYYKDLDRYAKVITDHIDHNFETIQLHLFRPVVAVKDKERHLENLFSSNELDDFLDGIAKSTLSSRSQ
jgi:hypothetical protein